MDERSVLAIGLERKQGSTGGGLMKFRVKHATTYRFSHPVFLEPHVIRLQPRQDGSVGGVDQRLVITPEPVARNEHLDAAGNLVTQCWFQDLTERLQIESDLAAETVRSNPFDYLLPRAASRLPFEYSETERDELSSGLLSASDATPVAELADAVAESKEFDTVGTLVELCAHIAENHDVRVREQGSPFRSAATLEYGWGSCRDLAVLFVDCCRHLGLAARFVSGYQAPDDDAERHDLHAWAEVYLPGAGWRGFDPTQGVAVGDSYVPLAAAPHSSGAAPVSGTFRGNDTGVESEFDVTVVAEP